MRPAPRPPTGPRQRNPIHAPFRQLSTNPSFLLPPDFDPYRRRREAEAPVLLLENPAQVLPHDRLLLRRRYAALVAKVLHRLLHAGKALAVLEASAI